MPSAVYLNCTLSMKFKVVESFAQVPRVARDVAYLVHTGWDDWFQYETKFAIHYFGDDGRRAPAQEVRISHVGLQGLGVESYNKLVLSGEETMGWRKTVLPQEFDALPESFFSLGVGDAYYEYFGREKSTRRVLVALRDVAYNQELYKRFKGEDSMGVSIMRGVSRDRLKNRYAKLAHGKPALTDFRFTYTYPRMVSASNLVSLEFSVQARTNLPSNIKVIVGRNGVGKTHLLRCLSEAICGKAEDEQEYVSKPGKVEFLEGSVYGVISASFSAFDAQNTWKGANQISFTRIGVTRDEPKPMEECFAEALSYCRDEPRRSRWLSCLEILKSDPILKRLEGERLLEFPPSEMRKCAMAFFKRLSSGHAALMLILAQLVYLLDEKFLVLIDEPECHLHPPLLASFIQCLSYLLRERNAIAIIATHSPVVLQEVAKDSVWILDRTEYEIAARRPSIETFGEGLGVLLNEIFGVEMRSSGYHALIKEAVEEGSRSYDEIVNYFEDHLGMEARAILRILLAERGRL